MVAPTWNLTVMKELSYTVLGSSGWDAASLPNLQKAQPGEKGVINVNAATTLDLDLGGQKAFRQVAVMYTTLDSDSNVGFTFSNNADMSLPVHQVAVQNNWLTSDAEAALPSGYRHLIYHHLAGDLVCRYVRIHISPDMAAPTSVGRVMIGSVVQPEHNADYGDTAWGYEEPDDPELLDSGVEVLVEKTAAPYLEFRLSWLSELEMQRDWVPLSRLAHEATPVLVVRRPGDPTVVADRAQMHQGMYYGRLRMRPIVAADFDMYEVVGKIRSMV